MRIALIGNMNNNFFSAMRYFRDLGLDAHLLMYANEQTHFLPENDTWRIEDWSPYVRTLPFNRGCRDYLFATPAAVRRELCGFDFFIGCGPAPAYFHKAGMTLDLMFPYGAGIEYIVDAQFRLSDLKRSIYGQIMKHFQTLGLQRNTSLCVSMDVETASSAAFRDLRLPLRRLSIPMVYTGETPPEESLPEDLRSVLAEFARWDFVVLSHAAHQWKNMPPHWTGKFVGKKNDTLIRGFAQYVQQTGARDSALVLFEYGVDVPESKRLIEELGIAAQVLWLPLMPRKKIMVLLRRVDFGAGEFGDGFWGGTGWEVMASGKPLLNYVRCTPEEFRSAFGHEIPPILNVRTPEEIAGHLARGRTDPEHYRRIGEESGRWFHEHDGLGLARKWKELIEELAGLRLRQGGAGLAARPGSGSNVSSVA